jgi:RHS repeat-associated protein
MVSSVGAQGLYQWESYEKRVDSARTIEALGSELFGDRVNLQNGGLSFTVTEVDVPGNNSLPVRFTRSYRVANTQLTGASAMLADWEVDVPRISGRFATEWRMGGSLNRCSTTTPPTVPSQFSGIFDTSSFWQGIRLEIPDRASSEVLVAEPGITRPTDGASYIWTTDGKVHLSCLSTIKNGTGQGFVARLPDGTRYYFDWMAQKPAPAVLERIVDAGGANGTYSMPVMDNTLYATKVEDRFGNTVTYTYANAANQPGRLTRIASSDGRALDIAYGSNDRITTLKHGSRTWTFTYGVDNSPNGRTTLSGVRLPDGRQWQIQFAALSHTPIDNSATELDRSCFHPQTPQNIAYQPTGILVHPSGARGTFTVGLELHGRSNVTLSCNNVTTTPAGAPPGNNNDPTNDNNLFVSSYYDWSLLIKEITGPGLSPLVWTYTYDSDISFKLYPGTTTDFPVCMGAQCYQASCTTDTCAGSSRTLVNGPDGSWERYVFGNSWQYNEGKLLRIERGRGAETTEVTWHAYDLSKVDVAYPARYGRSLRINADGYEAEFHRPMVETATDRDGDTFTWKVNGFDDLARPTTTEHSNTAGFTKEDAVTYSDLPSKWVMGQVKRSTTNGIETARADYSPTTGSLLKLYQFGQLQQTLVYRSDGTVSSVTDGNSQTTTLDSWYRGVPRTIGYPDGTGVSATLNGYGWITSVTDQNGYVTGYAYDGLGRLKTVTPPTGDTVAWTGTSITYGPMTSTYYGLPAGHWRRTEIRGNYRKETYYDALWRPVIEREFDSSTSVRRFRGWRYDGHGRVSFEGDPLTSASSIASFVKGTHTQYDALGRPLTVVRTSEIGDLTTSFEYQAGLQTQEVDPRGIITTTRYQAYDQPHTEWPVEVVRAVGLPEQATTAIVRDVFGKPLSITRYGGGVSAVRSYVYDLHHRLCKRVDPESGATLYDYDLGGNLSWIAEGQTLTALNCDRASVATSQRTHYTHDPLNRVTKVNYPDSTPDVDTTYTVDGLVEQISTGSNVWNYLYNRLRLPTQETLTYSGIPYVLGWAYTPLGHRSSLTTPEGTTIDYAPNALGQPTRAGTFATSATYFPDGTLKGFTYGNGIVRSLTQNARRLPSRIADLSGTTVLLDDRLYYDEAGNLERVNDVLNRTGGDRTLGYDGLNRLLTAQIGGSGNNEIYTYDALDNIRQRTIGSTTTTYTYDTRKWRLTKIGSSTISYDVRGNMTLRTGLGHSYNRANQLTAVVGRGSFEYDGFGRRTATSRADGTAKMDLYDRDGVLRYTVDNRNSSERVYVHLGSQLAAERSASWVGSGTPEVLYTHTDLLGSPIARSNSAGTIIEFERSRSYGQAIDGTKRDAPGFTGHMEDPELGLVYMQQRYYDPTIGRFLSTDPDPVNTATAWNFNRYAYANNNPYTFVDPDGRASEMAMDRFAENVGRNPEVFAPLAPAAVALTAVMMAPVAIAAAPEVAALLLGNAARISQATVTGAEVLAGDALGGAAVVSAATAAAASKISHLFDNPGHKLDALVDASGGSREKAFAGLQDAANQALAAGQLKPGPNGILPGGQAGAILTVNGVDVQLVGGRVNGDVVDIGSASRRYLEQK